MGINDKIRKAQQEQEEAQRRAMQRALEEAASQQQRQRQARDAERERQFNEHQRQEQRKLETQRRNKKLIDLSGVPRLFSEISGGVLARTRSAVVENLDEGTVTLVWGKFKVRNNSMLDTRSSNYSYITANYSFKESRTSNLKINRGDEIPLIPSSNHAGLQAAIGERIEDAIQTAFLNPERYEWRPPERYSSSSYTSTQTECSCT